MANFHIAGARHLSEGRAGFEHDHASVQPRESSKVRHLEPQMHRSDHARPGNPGQQRAVRLRSEPPESQANQECQQETNDESWPSYVVSIP